MAPILSVEGLSIGFQPMPGLPTWSTMSAFQVSRGQTFASSVKAGAEKASPARPFSDCCAKRPPDGGVSCSKAKTSERHVGRRLEGIRGKGIGMVFQDPLGSLNPVHTVGRQLDEALKLHTDLDSAGRQHGRWIPALGGHSGTAAAAGFLRASILRWNGATRHYI